MGTKDAGGPALRIWQPDLLPIRPREPQGDGLLLRVAWETLRLPEIQDRSPDHLSECATHVRRWGEFWQSASPNTRIIDPGVPDRTGEPVVGEITRRDLQAWREWLRSLTLKGGGSSAKRLSARAVNKHLGTVSAILRCCVAHDLLGSAPTLDLLPARRSARKLHLDRLEADKLKRACHVATWPRGLGRPARLYWEALIVGWCVYGFRTQEQVTFERGARGLRWGDIHGEEETPHPDGKARHAGGWLVYTPPKQVRFKPQPLVLPLVEAYRRHIDAIRPPHALPQDPVFPFPQCNRSFYEQWRAILAAAGIAPKPGLDGSAEAYAIKHLRKTSATWLDAHRPGLAELVQGHAGDRGAAASAVSRDHYVFAESRIIECLTTLPLPESFLQPSSHPRQRQLF